VPRGITQKIQEGYIEHDLASGIIRVRMYTLIDR